MGRWQYSSISLAQGDEQPKARCREEERLGRGIRLGVIPRLSVAQQAVLGGVQPERSEFELWLRLVDHAPLANFRKLFPDYSGVFRRTSWGSQISLVPNLTIGCRVQKFSLLKHRILVPRARGSQGASAMVMRRGHVQCESSSSRCVSKHSALDCD